MKYILEYPASPLSKSKHPEERIEVWTDGSVLNNGKPNATAGWSFAVLDVNGYPYIRYSHYVPDLQTNNRAEIMGVLVAIIDLYRPGVHLHIRSDSQYVINTITTWRHNWKRKNPDDIKNRLLFLKVFHLVDHGNITFEWVRGHDGTRGNELADYWAGQGMKREKPTPDEELNVDIRYIDYVKGVKDNSGEEDAI